MNFSLIEELEQFEHSSLNPCFDGICSMRLMEALRNNNADCSLNPCFDGICSMRIGEFAGELFQCLNPCFDGICSMSPEGMYTVHIEAVLILVLMEYAQ